MTEREVRKKEEIDNGGERIGRGKESVNILSGAHHLGLSTTLDTVTNINTNSSFLSPLFLLLPILFYIPNPLTKVRDNPKSLIFA